MIGQDVRRIETVTGHLLSAVGRGFVKIFFTFLGFLALGGAAVEGVYAGFHNFVFGGTLTHVAAVVFGLVLGYAAGLTMAVAEAIRALIAAGKDAAREVEKVEKGVVGDVERVVGGIEGKR